MLCCMETGIPLKDRYSRNGRMIRRIMRPASGQHVIEPFKIPSGWEIVRGYDFGYAKPFSVGWYAIDYTGTIYRIREYYGCVEGSPNVGIKMEPTEQARMIRQIEETDINLKGRKISGIADPSIFDRSRGKSVADMMAENGVYWSGGDNHRIGRKDAVSLPNGV